MSGKTKFRWFLLALIVKVMLVMFCLFGTNAIAQMIGEESIRLPFEIEDNVLPPFNRILPLDYTEADRSSREIWFEFNAEFSGSYGRCFYLMWPKRAEVQVMRNGDILVAFGVHSKYADEFLGLTTDPDDSLIAASGINGLKFGNVLNFEFTQDIRSVKIKYSTKQKKQVKNCHLKIGRDLHSKLEERQTYELAHAEAVKSARKFGNIAPPVLQQRSRETVPPSISFSSIDPSKIFRTDAYQTFIRGKVTDNEGVLTLLVNGRKAAMKADGTFAAKLKLRIGENRIAVSAEDINGNVAKQSLTIIREDFIPEETLADVDLPPKTKTKNPDGIAIVIGVENYQYVSEATYAYNDAEVFREYLASTLGYRKSRVKIVSNSKATLAEMNKLLGPNGWLARNVKENASDVVVYFSGHGIPDAKTKKTGLLPHDVDPNYSIGLPLKGLYRTLGDMKARSVTVFLDTCFSGQGREKQTLLGDKRGIMIVPLERSIPKSVSVLSAAASGQVSGPLKDKEHGLFTYYLLKGLGGAGDTNKDRQLSLSELGTYIRNQVKSAAASAGWNQTPEFQGDGSRMLVRYATKSMISVTKDAEEEIPGD